MKSKCPLSRKEFLNKAASLDIQIGDKVFSADPREFTSGRFGFYVGDKFVLNIAGKEVLVQANINVIVVDSKEA